jgi:hypothetical protein
MAEDILFSRLSGYNLYAPENDSAHIFERDHQMLRHLQYDSQFFILPLSSEFHIDAQQRRLENIIRNPPDLHVCLWPVDLIDVKVGCGAALVFPRKGMVQLSPLREMMRDRDSGWTVRNTARSWRDVDVQRLIIGLIGAWYRFARSGYAHHEYADHNISYAFEPSGEARVFFDFSLSTHYSGSDIWSGAAVDGERVSPDFADTYFFSDKSGGAMDLASDYYTMAVILFRLAIGRLPYDGSAMDGISNTTPGEHRDWIKIYHQHPNFIFDPEDDYNQIGALGHEEEYLNRWNALSEELKTMFIEVLRKKNAWREIPQEELIFHAPEAWLRAFGRQFGK